MKLSPMIFAVLTALAAVARAQSSTEGGFGIRDLSGKLPASKIVIPKDPQAADIAKIAERLNGATRGGAAPKAVTNDGPGLFESTNPPMPVETENKESGRKR